jgi:tyrosyl-tRNA synthetase
MTNYQSDLLRLLETRGYIHQLTDAEGLDALAAKQIVPGYIGFDPCGNCRRQDTSQSS